MSEKSIKITIQQMDNQIVTHLDLNIGNPVTMGELAMILIEIEKVKKLIIEKAENVPPVMRSTYLRK